MQYLTYILYLLQNVPIKLGPGEFACPYCDKLAKSKGHMQDHIYIHTGERPFPCPHCHYACNKKSNLKKHINLVHFSS